MNAKKKLLVVWASVAGTGSFFLGESLCPFLFAMQKAAVIGFVPLLTLSRFVAGTAGFRFLVWGGFERSRESNVSAASLRLWVVELSKFWKGDSSWDS